MRSALPPDSLTAEAQVNNPAVTVAEKNELIMLFQANALTEGVVTDESKAEVGDAIRPSPHRARRVRTGDWPRRALCVFMSMPRAG